jgi:hypothetical protein
MLFEDGAIFRGHQIRNLRTRSSVTFLLRQIFFCIRSRVSGSSSSLSNGSTLPLRQSGKARCNTRGTMEWFMHPAAKVAAVWPKLPKRDLEGNCSRWDMKSPPSTAAVKQFSRLLASLSQHIGGPLQKCTKRSRTSPLKKMH